MMLTARIKSCAAAVCVLAGCLLPMRRQKQSPFPCRNVPKLFRRSPRPRPNRSKPPF